MRAGGSTKLSSLAIAAALFGAACSSEEAARVAAAPEPAPPVTAPQPAVDPFRPAAQSQATINVVRPPPAGSFESEEDVSVVPQPVRRLVFQCTDDVSFAVRMVGNTLQVVPPGVTLGFVVLTQQPSSSGLLYTRRGAEFRSDGSLATLTLGDERYVDCVANPAAAVWEAPQRR